MGALRKLGLGTVATLVAVFLACGKNGGDAAPGAADGSVAVSDAGPGTDDGGDMGDGDGDGDAAPPAPPWDWVGVIGQGQSLSVGATAVPVVSTTQPYGNMKLVDNGPDPKYPLDGGGAKYALAPLTEPFRGAVAGYGDAQYPNNIAGETPHAGMANELTAIWKARTGDDYVSLHSVVGWSGNPLMNIDKEGHDAFVGRAYPGSLEEARAFMSLAAAAGKTFGVGAVVLTHGESDATNQAYGAGLVTFIDDYNADVKPITGQTKDIVLLVSQQSSFSAGGATGSAIQVWQVANANPTKIVCTGPKYQYGYSNDNVHLPATGYLGLGEKYAEVFDAVVNRGVAWKPVQPKTATRAGAVITVTFDVPSPPLVWSDVLAPPHQAAHTAWSNGKGFEVTAAAGGAELAIASVALAAPDTVTITLAADPGGPVTLAYAVTQDADTATYLGGQPTGMHGLLRDSDPLVGYDAESIDVTVTQGATTATATKPGAFVNRSVRDVVTSAGLAAPVAIATKPSNDAITLTKAWPGASGPATLAIQHDLYNYAVHFSMAVP